MKRGVNNSNKDREKNKLVTSELGQVELVNVFVKHAGDECAVD